MPRFFRLRTPGSRVVAVEPPRSRAPGVLFLTAALTALATAGALQAGVPAAQAASQDVYVSPAGSDHAPGTAVRPVRTLEHARDLVRSRHLAGDLTVHVASGVQRLYRPLELDARDSGRDGHRIIWQGSPGTVISGGRRVTGWRPGPNGVWSAPAPGGLGNTRQLYVDGVRAQRAGGKVPVTLTATATGYTASADTLAKWRNPGDVEFVYTAGEKLWNAERYGLGQWTEPRCPVASVSGTTITMAQPCWDNSMKRVIFPDIPGRTVNMVGPGTLTNGSLPAYAENALELLDQPGEWYLDRTRHRVYYKPRAGQDLRRADVEAPAIEKLVDANGVHDVAFRGLQFSYATWLTPSSPEGFSEIQAGYTITGKTGYATQGLCQFIAGGTCPYGSWTKEPGNVSVTGERVEFSDSVFTHLGAAGLEFGTGTKDAVVRGNVFTDISGNGVEIGGVDKPQADDAGTTRGNTVEDNHLYGLPREFHGGVAIINGYSQHDTIAHNQIDDVAYSAISMGWGGWPDKISKPATPNISHDNAVRDNLIFNYMQLLDDGGGIYTQGITGTSIADGEKVTGNVIHDQWGLGKNVYTDNGCTYETIEGNVLYNAAYANVASRHTDYRDALGNNDPTLVKGNYWQQGDPDSDNKGLVTQGNHILSDPSKAPADIVSNAGLEPKYRGLLGVRVPTTPEAPGRVATFAADGKVYVAWNPASDGAAPTSYTATATGGKSVTIGAADFRRTGYAVIDGLTNGTPYTVTVTARGASGVSVPSLPSAAVTPGTGGGALAAAPTSLKARASADAVALQWTPPTVTGDTPVIGYAVTVSDGRTVTVNGRDTLISQPTAKALLRVVNGLQPGTKYTFTIAAVTATGTGTAASVTATTPTG
ncbi:fibronectin type III domain-containing protein [Actinoallomurus sp. CA-150999]|uniref:right-handed parallel beta-helix repeat-containing protein n=1 Tax=Actinoallomurus sp. CA-150999 TaxID=3239887 RepID=UPI003D93A1B4